MNIAELLAKEIAEKHAGLVETIAQGKAASHEDYKYMCGQLLAYTMVLHRIKDLKDKEERSDD